MPDASGWSERARAWAEHWPRLSAPARLAVADALALAPGLRLLDAGCGSGELLALAASRGAVVSGIDASEAMLAIARERGPEADLRVGDIARLPWADGAFDVATAFNVVQFTADAAAAVAEFARAAPRVAICNWRAGSELPVLFAGLGRPGAPASAPAVGEPGVLERLLEDAGLEVEIAAEVATPYETPDLAALVTALREGSGLTGDIEALAAPYRRAGGSYRFENRFRYVVATRS